MLILLFGLYAICEVVIRSVSALTSLAKEKFPSEPPKDLQSPAEKALPAGNELEGGPHVKHSRKKPQPALPGRRGGKR